MNAEELKARSRKTITAPESGMDFSIRKLSSIELSEVQLKAILASGYADVQASEAAGNQLAMTAITSRMMLEGVRHIAGTVTPKIVFAEEKGEPVPVGLIDASWITADLDWIAEQVLSFSGLSGTTV